MTEYTKTQSASLANLLGKLYSDALDEIRAALLQSSDQKYVDLAGQVHDRGDESVANELIELENVLSERHVRELREIEGARRRLSAGTISHCAECGGDIGFKRLMAYPVAVRCVECQERHEQTHGHESTPRR